MFIIVHIKKLFDFKLESINDSMHALIIWWLILFLEKRIYMLYLNQVKEHDTLRMHVSVMKYHDFILLMLLIRPKTYSYMKIYKNNIQDRL